jgi:arylsulfatase A-like enzyme
MPQRPNVLFILADQLRATSLPIYGETQIRTPHIDRLAREGIVLDNAIASCPVCTPYRAMLLTGRYPQTTGHIFNFVRTRHDEIGVGDVFAHAGYRTGWVGKWHLHTGAFPHIFDAIDYVPEGRDRLGFQYWRGYNFHMKYFQGTVNLDDWQVERWEGYETEALARYAIEFMDRAGDDPFCLFLSPHQPHYTTFQFAPEQYYARLPEDLRLPANVPNSDLEPALVMYRHYLAMTLALDDMVGCLLDYLERTGKAANSIVVFTSDHGTQGGAHGIPAWHKVVPYEESIRVPWLMRWPGVFAGGGRRDTLVSPVDILPSLCGLCAIPIPRTVEGLDISGAWLGKPDAGDRAAVFTMGFSSEYNHPTNGLEWRGVRTKTHSYAHWLNETAPMMGYTHHLPSTVELYDLRSDPLQLTNLANTPAARLLQDEMEQTLRGMMAERHDEFAPCATYANWYDSQRRVIRNAYGPLDHPESEPDWSQLAR